MTRLPPPLDEDELDELPPLDGETVDEPESEEPEANEDLPDAETEDGAPSLLPPGDDLGDDVDLPCDEGEGSWLNEAPDAPDLNLGSPSLAEWEEKTASLEDTEASGDAEEDLEGVPGGEDGDLDAGDEGPSDSDEELREQDLPALDADAEGEAGDAGFVDARFAADEPLGLPWAAAPWLRVGAPLSLPAATAITPFGRGALVALQAPTGEGSRLVHVDLEGSVRTMAAKGWGNADPSALVLAAHEDTNRVALVLRGGGLLVSTDGGQCFEFHPENVVAADCLLASECLWIRTQAGGLLASRDGAHERSSLSGAVAAIAKDGAGGVVGLVLGDGGGVGLVRGESIRSLVREAGDDGPTARLPALFAARGGHIAYAGSKGGIVRRGPGGLGTQATHSSARWKGIVWDGFVTALGFVDEAGTLLAATYSDADDTTALVRVDASGRATIVAQIGAVRDQTDSDGRALSLACDDARRVVWMAGGFGTASFATARE